MCVCVNVHARVRVCEQIWKWGDLRDKDRKKRYFFECKRKFESEALVLALHRGLIRLRCKAAFCSLMSVFRLRGFFYFYLFFETHFGEMLDAGRQPRAVQMFSAGGSNKRSARTFILSIAMTGLHCSLFY